MDSKNEENGGEIENVRVVVRVRPMDKIEIDSGNENVIKVDKLNRCVTVFKPNAAVGEPPRIYYFDNIFAEDSSQVCMKMIHNFFYVENHIWLFFLLCFYEHSKPHGHHCKKNRVYCYE